MKKKYLFKAKSGIAPLSRARIFFFFILSVFTGPILFLSMEEGYLFYHLFSLIFTILLISSLGENFICICVNHAGDWKNRLAITNYKVSRQRVYLLASFLFWKSKKKKLYMKSFQTVEKNELKFGIYVFDNKFHLCVKFRLI